MRCGCGLVSKQVSSAVGTARPIRLDGAIAGRAGGQDFGAAARAEDEILLDGCAALRTGPRYDPGLNLLDRLNIFRMRVMSNVM